MHPFSGLMKAFSMVVKGILPLMAPSHLLLYCWAPERTSRLESLCGAQPSSPKTALKRTNETEPDINERLKFQGASQGSFSLKFPRSAKDTGSICTCGFQT